MNIYIPSRGRAGAELVWHRLPPPWREGAMLVVPKDEKKDYAHYSGVPVKNILAPDVHGIGAVRQWIVDRCDYSVLMLDDDIHFFARRKDDPTKLLKASPSDTAKMLVVCDNVLQDHAHIGIATREGANRCTDKFIDNTRLLRALGYRPAILKKHGIRFDRLPVMEDFDVALQLLRLGYPSRQVNYFTQDQGASNAPGGCSEYRTMEVQAKGAEGLAKLHPEFVTVVEKEPLKSGGWSGQARKDVRIAWKKAFASAGRTLCV